jgi:hypothetical protein
MTENETTVRDHMTAEEIIRLLRLQPHPEEGGFFAEAYRSAESVAAGHLPDRYGEPRCYSTAIYYLLTPETLSAMHRVASDEQFHFYLGDPVEQLHLRPDGSGAVMTIGPDIAAGARPLVTVPRGTWQGARLKAGGRFALMGATVAPGFEYADYSHGIESELLAGWPAFAAMISALCTPPPGGA